MTPPDHNKMLGITHLAYGGFHLLLMLLVSFIFFFMWAAARNEGGFDDAVFLIVTLSIIAFALLFTLPSLIAGYALLKRKTWARNAAILAGVFAIPSFPYGTALGVYSLWFMLSDEGKAFYANNVAGWMPGQFGSLPGAQPVDEWAAARPQNRREREHAPPKMPDWR